MAEKKKPMGFEEFDQPEKRQKQTGLVRSVLKVIFVLLLVSFMIAGGATAAVVYNYVNEAPVLDPSKLATVETSYLYDSSGDEITALHDEQNRIAVGLDEIPDHLKQAFIAIEDERFYDHFGFDIIGSLRAAYANFQAGEIVQGASTLTQQLAQNAFLTTEKTYRRKVQEIWLALQLERTYSKEEILEMYLNRIYFGNTAYGVEAAAQTYFDKNVGELTLTEAAMLAGAVRSPNEYNPINNEYKAEQRMRTVLSNMKRNESISEHEYREAMDVEMEYAELRDPEYPYPHYVDYVIHDELIKILSSNPSIGSREEAYRAIYTGGLRIYTNLEPSLQRHVEEVLGRGDLYPTTIKVDMSKAREAIYGLPPGQDLTREQLEELIDDENGTPQPQAAIVLADPTTGKIKALGGGRDYRKDVDEVLRFSNLRQPGSAIKPIITYAPAFEEGTLAGAGSTLDDSPFTGPQGWSPKNFDNRFRGMTTVREALYYSYNVPAVRAFEDLGPAVGVDYAERMGINTIRPDERGNLALTLGGFTDGVSAIDMAQAFGVLANEGVKVNFNAVQRVENRHGSVLYEQDVNPQQVLSPQATFLVNDILQDFVTEYLGRALQIDRPVAAKTGTTENWKDVYLGAYTPNLVATFWMGYDEPKMGGIQQGWRYSTAFLREVFLEAFKDLEIRDFNRPDGIVRLAVCSVSGLRPNDACRDANSVRSDYFIGKHAPRITCDYHSEADPEDEDEDNGEEDYDWVNGDNGDDLNGEDDNGDNGEDPDDDNDQADDNDEGQNGRDEEDVDEDDDDEEEEDDDDEDDEQDDGSDEEDDNDGARWYER